MDSNFFENIWTCLWEKMDIKLKRSTTFHPQTDGKMEVVNRKVVHILQGYYGKHPNTWDEHVIYINYAYN